MDHVSRILVFFYCLLHSNGFPSDSESEPIKNEFNCFDAAKIDNVIRKLNPILR